MKKKDKKDKVKKTLKDGVYKDIYGKLVFISNGVVWKRVSKWLYTTLKTGYVESLKIK